MMKSKLESIRIEQNQKLKNLQDILGLPFKIEEIFEAQPGSKIYKDVWKLKESKERAHNLHKQNQALEEWILEMEKYIENLNIENWEIWER